MAIRPTQGSGIGAASTFNVGGSGSGVLQRLLSGLGSGNNVSLEDLARSQFRDRQDLATGLESAGSSRFSPGQSVDITGQSNQILPPGFSSTDLTPIPGSIGMSEVPVTGAPDIMPSFITTDDPAGFSILTPRGQSSLAEFGRMFAPVETPRERKERAAKGEAFRGSEDAMGGTLFGDAVDVTPAQAQETAGILTKLIQDSATRGGAESAGGRAETAVTDGKKSGTTAQGDVTDITDQPDDLVEQRADSVEDVEGIDLGEGQTAAEKAFTSGMDAYLAALGQKADVGSIDDYKKQFADATGIDVSGKVDNSTALMAFGLALMQNKAGKGFNVGEILSSVGEAGEKALPAVAAAKKEAKASQIAAGKFALQERAKDISTAVARRNKIADRIAELSDKAYDRQTQIMVENLKGQVKLEDRRIQELAANQRESTKSLAAAGELGSLTKINLGGDDAQSRFEIQVQQVGKTGAFQFLDANGEMDRVNGMLKSADSQIATVNKMFDIAEAGDVSGAEGTYNYIASKLKGVGISLPGAQPEKIEEYNAAMGKLLTQARRLLTGGEAGNAISDRDVRIMEQNMGLERDSAGAILFSSPNQAMEYVRNLKELFSRKKEELITVKTRLYELGLRNGHYIDYKEPETGQLISENENFADDFAGYEAQIVDGKIRYTIKK